MPRYCAQRSRSDCGPIVLINALKWAGVRVTLRDHLPYFNQVCRPEGMGTSLARFKQVLGEVKPGRFTSRYRDEPSLSETEAHLKSGGAVILFYDVGPHFHFTLIIGRQGKGRTFLVVNGVPGKTVSRITRKTLKLWLRTSRPATWMINPYSSSERK